MLTVFNNDPNQKISYIYTADRIKQRKTVIDNAVITTTDYSGVYIYENGSLKFVNHTEGYMEPDGAGGYDYVYQHKDHLGNIRLSYADSNGDGVVDVNEIVEESNYYPFGLIHQGYNSTVNGTENKHKTFQGQELGEEHDKNTYAYQWRDYDPALGRFNKIDRFSEKYYAVTPYQFSANNPIFFKEINGDSIQGVSRKSARRVKRKIKRSFKGKKFRKLRKLVKKKGKKFKGIKRQDFNSAIQGLNADETALAESYFNAINSSEIHTVEAVRRGGKFSSALSNQFGDFNGDGKVNGADADDRTGGGFNFKTSTGSHTVIIMNSTVPITDYVDGTTGARVLNRTSSAGELLAHELLGHGLTNYNVGGNQFLNAIQLTNLYNRVTTGSSRFYRDGSRHGGNPRGSGVAIPGSIAQQVPLYLR